jgi:type IV pilus assembly protein PilN
MYSLDINFLNDRPDIRPQVQGNKPKQKPAAMTPLILGVALGLLLPGVVGGLWFFVQQQTAQLETRQAELDSELQRLQIEQDKIKQLNDEIAKVQGETNDLASVFNQIKPWSAMLQDIRERIPLGVQIQTIQQTEDTTSAAAAAPTPAASPSPADAQAPNAQATSAPSPTMKLAISGRARSFDEVNYFLLTLQRSPFFKSNETQLVKAELVQNPNKVEVTVPQNKTQSGATVTYTLPKTVDFQIQTSLSDIPASELLRELDRKGAVGLVTRIRTLQEKGVIQP